jgi:hypothetical protein
MTLVWKLILYWNAVKLKPAWSLEINVFIRAYYYMYGKVEIIYVMFNERVGVFYHNIKHDA